MASILPLVQHISGSDRLVSQSWSTEQSTDLVCTVEEIFNQHLYILHLLFNHLLCLEFVLQVFLGENSMEIGYPAP